MNIEFNKTENNVVIAIDGRLDTTTAPELESSLKEIYDEAGFLTFDCEKLSYISSAGLRVLLSAHKKMKGEMKLINVNELVTEVLEMTGFADIWVIE
jgi:anti-sigma B factor antagonist